MTVYVIVVGGTDNVLGVYDSEWLAFKRKAYFDIIYKNDEIKIIEKYMEYADRE
ncbi:hypothetical protein [uncultured Mucilaginibacter sp.]|uniref:hypothetical protein n=1 Tax=uncultured Mucilaginibacter sp. TaxID=797541 RepID=UPI0025E680A7|nr:hypothetical protein [uncultured Mucilaginibacter sp.]